MSELADQLLYLSTNHPTTDMIHSTFVSHVLIDYH